jgi:hypothetical protein
MDGKRVRTFNGVAMNIILSAKYLTTNWEYGLGKDGHIYYRGYGEERWIKSLFSYSDWQNKLVHYGASAAFPKWLKDKFGHLIIWL